MSWFIGYIGRINHGIKSKFDSIYHNYFSSIANDEFTIYYGGKNLSVNHNFLSAGIFLKNNIITHKPVFKNHESFLREYTGHYACVYFSDRKIIIFNDLLGIREFFIFKSKEYIIFASSPDLIAKIIEIEINFKAFAGRWLLENQFGYSCIYDKIERYLSNSCLEINLDNLDIIETKNKSLNFINNDKIKLIPLLTKKLKALNHSGKKIKLMLSGGLDSRFLLALCLKSEIEFEAVSVGPSDHPDNSTAKELCKIYNIKYTNFEILLDKVDITKSITDFVIKSRFSSPASEFLRKYIYFDKFDDEDLIIDGSFGEIIRRGFFNKLLYRCKSEVKNFKYLQISNCLHYFHADIFTAEFNNTIELLAIEQIKDNFRKFSETISIDEFSDLLGINHKLLNYNNYEQNRIDSLALNLCPFSQSDVINTAFNLNQSEKKDARLIKNFIKYHYPEMTSLPLVKGNIKIPFGLNTFNAKLLTKVKNKFKLGYNDKTIQFFLNLMKDYNIQQIGKLNKFEFIDKEKLNNQIVNYKADNYKNFEELDWIVTLAIFFNNYNSI